MTAVMRIIEWRPQRQNTLRGFVVVEMPSGMIMAGVTIHRAEQGAEWASPPSKPMVGHDGIALKDGAGKLQYTPIISFKSRDLRDRFSKAVIEALGVAHPEAFAP
jgi:hypothetical protein